MTWPSNLNRTMAGLALVATLSTAAAAQRSWVVEQTSSLAWWEVSPNLGYLWATTCPGDPSWSAGEPRRGHGWDHYFLPWVERPVVPQSREAGWHGAVAVSDTTFRQLFARRDAYPVCGNALDGRLLVVDANVRGGFRAQITVLADRLTTGSEARDHYAHRAVLHVRAHPQIKFTIDSVVGLTEHADTVRGTARGVLTLRGVAKPLVASVSFWNDTAAGGMRVLAKTHIPVWHLWSEYRMSQFALGSIGADAWQDVWMGVDLVLKPDNAR